MPIQSINPATGRLLRSFEPLPEHAVTQKIAVAQAAFRAYREVPLEHRALCMRKLASILEQEVDDLAAVATEEVGKTFASSRQEVLSCAACCRYYAENAPRMLADERVETTGNNGYLRWGPLGVILAVMPWNSPFWQVFRSVAPALMGGNVILLKHASNVPQTALLIESLIRRAGFPRGSLQTLLIESTQVEFVLYDERVTAVIVTDSGDAGRAVAAQAGSLIKRSVLKLGGSSSFLVMPTANLELAVQTAVQACILNTGQSCITAKRFIVHEAIYQELEARLVAAMEALKVGDPMKSTTNVGPLPTAKVIQEVQQQVEAAKRAGGRVITGGERMLGVGNYFEPTVLVEVPRTSAVYRQEILGPVAMLFRVISASEAIEVANETPFNLRATVWTEDPEEQERLIAELHCAQIFVNAISANDLFLPFSGVQQSGSGRELSGARQMSEFLSAKIVLIAQAGDKPEALRQSPGGEADTGRTPEASDGFKQAFFQAQSPNRK